MGWETLSSAVGTVRIWGGGQYAWTEQVGVANRRLGVLSFSTKSVRQSGTNGIGDARTTMTLKPKFEGGEVREEITEKIGSDHGKVLSGWGVFSPVNCWR